MATSLGWKSPRVLAYAIVLLAGARVLAGDEEKLALDQAGEAMVQGRYFEAVEVLERALQSAPENTALLYYQGAPKGAGFYGGRFGAINQNGSRTGVPRPRPIFPNAAE